MVHGQPEVRWGIGISVGVQFRPGRSLDRVAGPAAGCETSSRLILDNALKNIERQRSVKTISAQVRPTFPLF